MGSASRDGSSSIRRVLSMLETIARAEHPPLATDLALQLDIPRATAHRLVQTLEQEGFIRTNLRGQLIPAQRLEEIAFSVLYTGRFSVQRQAILQGLAERIGETCGIAIPRGTEMIYYDRVQCHWPLQIHLPIGSRVPVWCSSSGKLYLAGLPEHQLDRVLQHLTLERRARNTLTEPEALKRALVPVREHELGTDNEEFIDGMVACSVPIRRHGELLACLFCHAPVLRRSMEDMLALAPMLREAATALEAMLGEGDGAR
ncbi:IclR family transcriptional regulator [Kushneria sinocarnis]|uniref:HTH-type transcriptional repressor AllR n=1 Tax=Kushneria sinocarnis TaxID=595502 RepID=A0A420X120_9GAMM|nr:IclR family transcriptional regulator [Kushneria sinocarnis]RKR07543.1 IclR family transcriptional regulator [Kushneria sinocarnis]